MIRFFRAADIVKLSEEDLNYLHPEWSKDAWKRLLKSMRLNFVSTAGSDGLVGLTRCGVSVHVPAVLPESWLIPSVPVTRCMGRCYQR